MFLGILLSCAGDPAFPSSSFLPLKGFSLQTQCVRTNSPTCPTLLQDITLLCPVIGQWPTSLLIHGHTVECAFWAAIYTSSAPLRADVVFCKRVWMESVCNKNCADLDHVPILVIYKKAVPTQFAKSRKLTRMSQREYRPTVYLS